MRGQLASSSPGLGESHLLWDYPDFCQDGRRGPSAYMPSSPGRVRRGGRSFTLSPGDGQENLAKVISEIQKVLPTPKAAGSHTETVTSRPPRRFTVEEAEATVGASRAQQRGWAYFLPMDHLVSAPWMSNGSWQGQVLYSHLETGTVIHSWWACTLRQPFWRKISPSNLKTYFPFDPLLGICQNKYIGCPPYHDLY